MKNNDNNELFQLFVDQLEDVASSENQIIKALPNLIKITSCDKLKKALTDHLAETKHQVERLNKICSILKIKYEPALCKAMQGILAEAEEMIQGRKDSAALDAAIIAAAQKVEHYEIATYGTLRSFAKQLELDSKVVDLLQETLDEACTADRALTKIAEGSLFTSGVNKAASECKECVAKK